MKRTWPKLLTFAVVVYLSAVAATGIIVVGLFSTVVLAANAAGGELKIQVTSFPPGQELRPGVAVLLSVSGSSPDAVVIWHPPEIEGDVFLKVGKQYLFAGTAAGPRTIVVQIPAKGEDPFAVVTFHYGDQDADPPPPPPPGKVAGVLILEEQHDRTAKQARIMDDPVWQIAAKTAGLTWAIEDKDHPSAARAVAAAAKSKLALPVVCLIDSAGEVIGTREFPATVEEMRALIGGLK